MKKSEEQQLKTVIADFIELGHIENIVAMFKKDPDLYKLTGDLLHDERYMVRMGMAVLFEELAQQRPAELPLAVPALRPLLTDTTPYIRGEAITLLGIINTAEALAPIVAMTNDPDPQVAEIARDIINGQT